MKNENKIKIENLKIIQIQIEIIFFLFSTWNVLFMCAFYVKIKNLVGEGKREEKYTCMGRDRENKRTFTCLMALTTLILFLLTMTVMMMIMMNSVFYFHEHYTHTHIVGHFHRLEKLYSFRFFTFFFFFIFFLFRHALPLHSSI